MVARRGHPMTAATRAKISAALKGKKHPHKGHAVSAQTKAKISAALTGKPHPHAGHPMTAATRAKLSAAAKARATSAARTAAKARAASKKAPLPKRQRPGVITGTVRSKAARARTHSLAMHKAIVTTVANEPGVIGTLRIRKRVLHHRPIKPLLLVGVGYHHRRKSHLHVRKHRPGARLRIRHMGMVHRPRPRRMA